MKRWRNINLQLQLLLSFAEMPALRALMLASAARASRYLLSPAARKNAASSCEIRNVAHKIVAIAWQERKTTKMKAEFSPR